MSGNRSRSRGTLARGLLAALFVCCGVFTTAWAAGEEASLWSLVEVSPVDSAALAELHAIGVEVLGLEGRTARVLANPLERQWLAGRGLAQRVLIDDYGLWLWQDRQAGQPRLATAGAFATGSMGGFFSPEEITAFVDSLIRADRHGILSPRFEIGRSLEDRPLWAVRVSDHAAVDEDEPEVLYNSLIHAREGAGVMCLLYYLKWLVENYGTVDSVTALVDSRELYFIPVLNPDGYERNWQSVAGGHGFGLWRKNARDNNGNGVIEMLYDGVDLNRNFDFMWGYDNSGSSQYTSWDSYRGPAAFSEPESRALRDFINARHLACAVNFHSYSNVLINPWGYDNLVTPDEALYVRLGTELTAENGYRAGTASQTLSYRVNGELTDWEYGDSSHSKIMAWSLELGTLNDDFWPAASRVDQICRENLPFCYSLSRLAGFWPGLDSLRVEYAGTDSAGFSVEFRLTNRGYPPNPAPLAVRLESAETRLALGDTLLALPDLPLDSLTRMAPGRLGGAFLGKLDRASLELVLYCGDSRLAAWPLTVRRGAVQYYDLDHDGRVNVFDLLALLRRLGQGPSGGADDTVNDLNDDGRVNVFDLLTLLRRLAAG